MAVVFNLLKKPHLAKAPITDINHHDKHENIDVSSDIEVDEA
jgi:hypothetical protein